MDWLQTSSLNPNSVKSQNISFSSFEFSLQKRRIDRFPVGLRELNPVNDDNNADNDEDRGKQAESVMR